MQQIFPP